MALVKRGSGWELVATAAATLSLLSACAGPSSAPPPLSTAATGPACLDDSQRCIDRRQKRLALMRADRSFGWVFDSEPRAHFATGVKLFAYDLSRKDMACRELSHGVAETRNAKTWLRKPQSGISAEQLLRARMLNDDVHKRLSRAARKRGCRRIA